MPTNEPIQQGPYPLPADPPDGPNQMSAIVSWAAGRLMMRFASPAARDAEIPTPTDGMVCCTGSGSTLRFWVGRSSAWADMFAVIGGDTAWQNADTNSGFELQAGNPLRYRVVAGGVYLTGGLTGDVGTSGAYAATIPEEFAPSNNAFFFGGGSTIAGSGGRGLVASGGAIFFRSNSGTLDSVEVPLGLWWPKKS